MDPSTITSVTLPSRAEYVDFCGLFHVLSAEARVEIIKNLRDRGELAAGEIAAVLPRMTAAAVSQHLAVMFKYGFLERRKEAQRIFYKLDKTALRKASAFIDVLEGTLRIKG